ncbi:phosphoglucosamine mutase [Vulgatibacter incomptus]|uniref:Phosphoglucosamine mutase n=1 Tax=Vulgatibacter incomptus TaxID=1391653 RepID=A0A0K1PET2_9BACT|nr:phosphoglucosamine mutase [Vulgatibacter incomptus]AKU91629.1 Phosphoglucosamine mutase [Vulgatibacter incomptus]
MNEAKPASRKLFGTDGVRGVANIHPMTAEMALQLGRALAFLIRNGSHRHKIVIGKDTRLSGYMLEGALMSGVCSMGVDAVLVGPIPTPGISFLVESMRADAGAVISASHNPYQDNGIKFFARDGFKLPDETEARLESLIFDNKIEHLRPTATKVGKAFRIDDAGARYVVHLKAIFPRSLTLEGMTVVIDCGNGAAYKVAPMVFEELGAKVIRLGVEPDGKNINNGAGALHPERMCKAVVRHKAQIGIALDGDADRVIVADEKGEVIDGDAIMAICGRHLLAKKHLAKKTVVATVMSNMGLDLAMAEVGGKVVRTQVGDRYVVERMRRDGLNFGGEQSGHLVFLDHATTGDGIVAALSLLAVMLETGKPLSELSHVFVPVPQTLLNVPVKQRRDLDELPTVLKTIRGVELKLGKDGRVLVRFSGTEAKARVLVEGPDARSNETYAREISEALTQALR